MSRRAAALVAALLAGPAFAAERVITLSPHLAELACAAGGCDRLVGSVAWTDHPEAARMLPRVGDAWAVNAEQVVALRPDLVLAWDGGTPRATLERLRGLKLRVEPVRVDRLEDVASALRRVGQLIGTARTGEAAALAYERRLEELRARHAERPPIRVLYQIETQPLYSVSRASPISRAIELCGGINVFADLPGIAAPVDREAVLARDPQAVIYTTQDDAVAIREYWQRAPAVAATRVHALYALDGNTLDRATPRMLDGVESLCAALDDARGRNGIAAKR